MENKNTKFKKGMTPWNKGRKFPEFSRENSSSWKGGVTRYIVLERVKETGKKIDECQICNSREKIHLHHINGDRSNNEPRNISIVCSYCHYAIHDNGRNTRFKPQQEILA